MGEVVSIAFSKPRCTMVVYHLSFCANTPTIYVDKDGKDFRYTVQWYTVDGKQYANIKISTTIHLYGKDACSIEQSQLNQKLTGNTMLEVFDPSTGETRKVTVIMTVDINYQAHETLEQAQAAMQPGDNTARVDQTLSNTQMTEMGNKPSTGEVPSSVKGLAQRGGIYSNIRRLVKKIFNHEAMHQVGLKDRTTPINSNDPDSPREADDTFEETIMDNTVEDLASIKLHKTNIIDLAKQVLSKTPKKNVNTTQQEVEVHKGPVMETPKDIKPAITVTGNLPKK